MISGFPLFLVSLSVFIPIFSSTLYLTSNYEILSSLNILEAIVFLNKKSEYK